jgi:plastocyanin
MRLSRLIAVAVAVILPACDGTTGPGDGTGSGAGFVSVIDDRFEPTTVHPAANGLVTWIWGGSYDHNVIFQDGIGNSILRTIGIHRRDFRDAAAGTYRYRCTLHAQMVGEVVVP